MSGEPLTPLRPMVHVRTVPTAFHARVIQARLGADGIPAQLRGNFGGPYPFGAVSVWVGEDDAADAGDLLLADEVEAAFDVDPTDEDGAPGPHLATRRWPLRRILATIGLVLMLVAAFSTHIIP
jgi:Putative prokaryotic signal transducing protein